MTHTSRKRFLSEKEIERFCTSTKEVLKKIYDRINEEQSKKQKGQKAKNIIVS